MLNAECIITWKSATACFKEMTRQHLSRAGWSNSIFPWAKNTSPVGPKDKEASLGPIL